MVKDEYRGPGTYEVTVRCTAYETVTVEADSLEQAISKAEEAADPFDFEAEASDWECTSKTVGSEALRESLTGLEEAFWMFTGKVPQEAYMRLAEEAARAEACTSVFEAVRYGH